MSATYRFLFSRGAHAAPRIFVYIRICIISYAELTRECIAPTTLSTHSRVSSLFIVKTNSDECDDSFFPSSPQTVCVHVCVYLHLPGRLLQPTHENRKNLRTNTAAAGHATSGRCQALYTVALAAHVQLLTFMLYYNIYVGLVYNCEYRQLFTPKRLNVDNIIYYLKRSFQLRGTIY